MLLILRLLRHAEIVLDRFEGAAFGFGDNQLHPDELEDHHEAKEGEDGAGVHGIDHLGEDQGQ